MSRPGRGRGAGEEETVVFALDGVTYRVRLDPHDAARLRQDLAPYVDRAVELTKSRRRARTARAGGRSAFSLLSTEEKQRFRRWADQPTARRIADGPVLAWIAAGMP
ncbi:MAG TPA: histone-like nucleoid-structuring protein Lsr2 [Acidimicrobiales bacterium]|jgi:hypothetical protein